MAQAASRFPRSADLRRRRDLSETMLDLVIEKRAGGRSLERIRGEGGPAA